MQETFLNFTNNRIKCLNSKIKQVIPLYSSVEEFFKKLQIFIKSSRIEKDKKAIIKFLKTSQVIINDDIITYYKHLTQYAFNFVSNEFEKIPLLTYNTNLDNITFSDGAIVRNYLYCDCQFKIGMNLPCCHIFVLEKV